MYGNLVYNIAGYALNWNYGNSVPAPPRKYPVPFVIIENNILIISGVGESQCVGHTYLPNTTFELEFIGQSTVKIPPYKIAKIPPSVKILL